MAETRACASMTFQQTYESAPFGACRWCGRALSVPDEGHQHSGNCRDCSETIAGEDMAEARRIAWEREYREWLVRRPHVRLWYWLEDMTACTRGWAPSVLRNVLSLMRCR